ncbi:1-deoxy-D-xylulose 5-phosphate reductoisomerase [Candidatus Rhabdochlamydia oedothoracis]|uniref:1-deoxy-D-xylulose 5-phosphate reductoisomerase n=1 Tax=Candidatus Rhabdochlamydia oedothoracis TaxID=2720720 RepID=A0ABX8V831_9BACT|nr:MULTISPECIES: 1-deoxy-D-xylulose-5-phosphate reductoisomerase [Rhabdochlamydia]KAG6559329.1 1-deoxy-D-xylulose 5-phosphate reductoisomerase [Candidatus Rhabdochlamydia sp. W815]QYF49178.1 1-deoxy-D-xylulose 5-phosphate reductoisomerase [Candidatus Rhabdochlamydia oedothoracis]
MKQKNVVILGSTGSIGTQTLDVIDHLKPEGFKPIALAAHSQIDLLEQQAHKWQPQIIAVYDQKKAFELQKRLPQQKIVTGIEGLKEVASLQEADIVVSAMSGSVGIEPTLSALKVAKNVALANKEVLVAAGELIMRTAKEHGASVLPIDSEHSALFQCLEGKDHKSVRRLLLTASGGPFLGYSRDKLCQVTLKEALMHPTWQMGVKNTIDSSTLMNKGLELIEAHFLFGITSENIEIVIHPQSVIHSMVEFIDGSMLAQMSAPTMLVPIQYALSHPKRYPGLIERFDYTNFSKLEFLAPNPSFKCINLCYYALKQGGTTPCYLNAVNEILVERFVKGEILWIDISDRLEKLLMKYRPERELTLEKILETDRLGRLHANSV